MPDQPRIVLFANAETALHDFFGDEEYWRARRSMRFNNELISIANDYRRDFLDSEDKKDLVQRPVKWIDEKVVFNLHFNPLTTQLNPKKNFSHIQELLVEIIYVCT